MSGLGDERIVTAIYDLQEQVRRTGDGLAEEQPTLRDRFAMATLTGLFSNGRLEEQVRNDLVASACYRMADAMLIARERKP